MIETKHLFEPLDLELIALLRGLSAEQWHAATVAGDWRVRDVAAHLLQTAIGRLSAHRDGYTPPLKRPPQTYDEVRALVNENNRVAAAAMRGYSPRVLTDQLETVGAELTAFLNTLEPDAPAFYAVSWAGESESLNWLDVGREYTERWHHQMQIRDAVGVRLLLDPFWTMPLFALSVRALPRTYADVHAPDGSVVGIRIENGGDWSLVRRDGGWQLDSGVTSSPAAEIDVTADDAWRIFYHALSGDAAVARLRISGDPDLARPFAGAHSVIV